MLRPADRPTCCHRCLSAFQRHHKSVHWKAAEKCISGTAPQIRKDLFLHNIRRSYNCEEGVVAAQRKYHAILHTHCAKKIGHICLCACARIILRRRVRSPGHVCVGVCHLIFAVMPRPLRTATMTRRERMDMKIELFFRICERERMTRLYSDTFSKIKIPFRSRVECMYFQVR